VDAMVSDNTSNLEAQVANVDKKIDELKEIISRQMTKDNKKAT
jgi:hypothetical protein